MKEILDLKHSERWINLVQIFDATGFVEKLDPVLIIMSRDKIKQSWSVQHNQWGIAKSKRGNKI